MEIVSLIVRLLIAATFLVAGVTKLIDLKGTLQGIREFGVPSWAIRTVGFGLPVAELAVAALSIPRSTVLLGSSCAVALLLLFIAGISINLARGRKPRCNCFGQVHSEPIGWSMLIRNTVLAAGASVVFLQSRNHVPLSVMGWANGLSMAETVGILIGTCALVLVGVQGCFMFCLFRENRRLRLRMDASETSSPGSGAAPAYESSGLPTGTPAPAFQLANLRSPGIVRLGDLLAERRPVLLIFLDPDCSPCVALLPTIVRWEQEHGSVLTFALISRGSPKANRAKIGKHPANYVLLQKDREVAAMYSVNGTPGAVMISIDGLVGSHVAVGAQEIADLVSEGAETRPSTPTHA